MWEMTYLGIGLSVWETAKIKWRRSVGKLKYVGKWLKFGLKNVENDLEIWEMAGNGLDTCTFEKRH